MGLVIWPRESGGGQPIQSVKNSVEDEGTNAIAEGSRGDDVDQGGLKGWRGLNFCKRSRRCGAWSV